MNRPFNFNIFIARERRTFQMLLLVVMVLLGLNFSLPLFVKRQASDYSDFQSEIEAYQVAQTSVLTGSTSLEFAAFDINQATATDLEQYGLSKAVADRWIKYRDAIGGFDSINQVQKIYGLDSKWYQQNSDKLILRKMENKVKSGEVVQAPVTLFSFDPNIVTDHELELLGFSPVARKSILNYRDKGGNFYRSEELKYLKGMHPDFFHKISSYVAIDTSILPHIAKEPRTDIKEVIKEPDATADASIVIDVNNSNVFQWQMLKGIGAKYAARIINYRERLGGFANVHQVAETYNIPDSVFQSIRPFLTISPITRPLQINLISVDSLRLHPYIDWKQASIIVNYRTQHGPYQTPEDLLKTRVFDTAFIRKIEPYLVF